MWLTSSTFRILSLPVAALATGLLCLAPAWAQTAPAPSTPQAKGEPSARPKLPRDRRTQLDALFEALRLAPDESSAKALGTRLDAFLAQTGSPSADLLMARAELAAQAKEYDLALELLDAAIAIVPDNLALLSRRASIKYAQDDYSGALADLGEVLTREPRNYTALLGLALIMREVGDDKRALEAARKALAINPHLDAAKEIVDDLKVDVEGREI
ncbi:tetratricopeptide repeat protein [Aquabacter sp. CN5-332]|uniref:tetratricopeptide repeat protein n=1 Tax=Aquabacter sp. CN5-332 TaxID=3156608 RepID=UPI0032B57C1C